MKIVVFSKDRAMQLDALLRSIDKYCIGDYELSVLYFASDDHKKSYASIIDDRFVLEHDFAEDARTDGPVMFFVDDCLMVRPCDIKVITNALKVVDMYSCRLGLNIAGAPVVTRHKGIIEWDGGKGVWGYGASLDGNAFASTEGVVWDSPWSIEKSLRKTFRTQACGPLSCSINVAVNKVRDKPSETVQSLEYLKDEFESGKRIDIDKFKCWSGDFITTEAHRLV